MRYRLMASFQGASYQAGVGPSDEEVTLFAACPPPEELGFRSSSNHWRKRVRVDEIDALWEARPVGRYRGERCMVLDDLGDRMHIAYLGRDLYLARRLGFWEVDRGVFEVVVPRQEIDDLREERGEYELALVGASGPNGRGGWDRGSRETWAHTPREYGRPAPDTGPLRAIGAPGLIDTGPSWAADPRLGNAPSAGWDHRDSHAQDPRDTGTWAAVSAPEEPAEPDDPFPRGRGGWRARDTGGWEAPDTGSFDVRDVQRAIASGRAPAPGWNPAQPDPGANQLVAGRSGGWPSQPPPPERTDRWSTPGYSDDRVTGSWNSGDFAAPAPAGQPERNWDPQDTMDWNPVSAGEWGDWEPNEMVRESYSPPPTAAPPAGPAPDAAAVWHGSPFPDDGVRWSPSPGTATPEVSPRPAESRPAHSRYDDPPLARQAAAITGAYGAPVPAAPAPEAAAAPAPAAPAAPAPAAEPSGSRYVGRRSARKARVTTQSIFSQLLDLAAIPQSSYAVDTEVDGAMCLVRARGGYEVFSSADQSRHEVRYFEDEEAAYFYLFGVLAAEAIRNGQLGPQR
ncbi:MAG TPA: hypothetical protein VN847_15825 [Streptosporangiaceae bacterium]|nr:hypothetical protein [Streptosporangiaceae bacterium]